ncbi:SDR family NAD(P)-dependent oxidoreductase, partial [Streptomyces sp. ActVer]|uniref:SDR family NAD(P)-dependent oxidoreductase n=1 Tax=Streptomyces sp. ActVer TaxID=3014558 RepID=UPI0022B50F65
MGTSTAPGAMLAVRGADEQDVAALVAASPGELAVAAYNGPGRLVISGGPDVVERAAEKLAGLGAAVRPLRVPHAFHSPLMEPVAQALADAAHVLDATAADLPLMSTLTAEWQPRMDADHLREHALRPVLFGRAVARLLDEGYDTFVELGPDENLSGPIRAAAARRRATGADPATAEAHRPADNTGAGPDGRVLVVSAPGEADRAGAAKGGTPGGARELLTAVGRLWARGVTLDRTALDAGRRRVPLPPYPYQRRRYWPDTAAHGLLHRVSWQSAPLADGAPAGPVLVTGVDTTAVRELAEQLAARGVEVTTDPGVAVAQTVILPAGPAEHGTAAEFERMQRRWVTGFREALALFGRTGARRLVVVTEDVHVTGHGSERPDPAQAVLGALALAVPEEFPGVVANWVDLASLDDAGHRLRAVLAEAAAPQAAGVVAWRDGRRLVRTVVPQSAEIPHGGERLPADGTFLITGGCGGIGSALARDLAGRGRPIVILTGRSPQPPEGLVEELAALGADARYHPADLATQDDVDKLVAQLPPLDGVFHAAGVVRPGSLRSTDVQEAVDALQAKTLGTMLLSEALHRHGQRPGACVAFSSVSSVLPGLAGALGVYAAANAFLDSFAAAERRAGRPWLSVNLGPFRPRAPRLPGTARGARRGRAAGAADR